MWTNMSIRSLPEEFNRLNTVGQIGVGLLGVYGSYVGAKVVYGMYKRLANGKIRRKKQQENAQSIEDLATRLKRDPLLVDRATYITNLSLSELSRELKEGKIRPIEALKAYQSKVQFPVQPRWMGIGLTADFSEVKATLPPHSHSPGTAILGKKALDIHSKTNCLVEVITQAEEWALELEKGPREGALWGVPISIKDDVGIKGYDSTIGMVIKVGKPSEDTAELLKVLCKEGAIPFVKTNVPQTEMSFEPGNPINGIVHNPHRHGYGPGGSSSGEAALIASGGSLLGIGSDLGGSIRVPAHFCGVFGFKPTSERISPWDMGPLSRDMEGVETVMKALWGTGDMAKADPECIPKGFDTKTFTSDRKLRIGYYLHNGLLPTFSACVRATEKAKNILSSLGHELVPWQPPEPAYIFDLTMRVFQADGGKALREELRYDKIDPTLATFTKGLYTPVCIKKLLSYLIHPFNAEVGTQIYSSCGAGDVAENAELTYELWKLRRVVQDSWNTAGLDAVICPPQAIVAPPLGNSELLFATCLFTATYNMLHFPAGVVPVTRVLHTDVDHLQQDFPPGNRINNMARSAMSDTVDLPVGVMVASARYHDETCLRVMKMIDEGLQKGN